EREVMTRVAAGKLNKVIADELHIAVRTVEVHRARVFSKLGVRSAAELAGWLAMKSD
ncbi:MAG: DNA-binding response regulator, partial [Burkholderiales bacterium]|nr:DNA-binding response regulator [Burkholderiales bacterium]